MDILEKIVEVKHQEVAAAKNQLGLSDRIALQLPVVSNARSYNLFDDEEGEDWQEEPNDWWQHDSDSPNVQPEAECGDTVNREGESVQAALNARLRRTTRLTFFDDESGEEGMQLEPDDVNLVTGLVDKRGWPEFAKATKFDGAWMGMVFRRGPRGLGYYRDVPKLEICATSPGGCRRHARRDPAGQGHCEKAAKGHGSG